MLIRGMWSSSAQNFSSWLSPSSITLFLSPCFVTSYFFCDTFILLDFWVKVVMRNTFEAICPVLVWTSNSQAYYLGMLVRLWEIWFSMITDGLTCLCLFIKSSISRINASRDVSLPRTWPTNCCSSGCHHSWFEGNNSLVITSQHQSLI